MKTQQEKTKTVEINDINSIVLTKNGTVVGYITVKNVGGGGDVEFIGQAVNINNFPRFTYNGFACRTEISTKNIIDVASDYYFLQALESINA